MYSFMEYGNEWLEWAHEHAGIEWDIIRKDVCDYYMPIEGSKQEGRAQISSWTRDHSKRARGAALYSYINETVEADGVEVMYDARAKKLIMVDGVVAGVTVETKDGDINIKSRNGVLLGTGGFEYDAQMRHENLPYPLYNAATVPTCEGDGHKMAREVGAKLILMDKTWGTPTFYAGDTFDKFGDMIHDEPMCDWNMSRGKPGAIVVNQHGKRFGNECSGYDSFNRDLGRYGSEGNDLDNMPAVFICDQECVDRYAIRPSNTLEDGIPEFLFKADTLEEVAEHFGIDTEALLATVAEFNKNAELGIDPLFGRGTQVYDMLVFADNDRDDLANPCLAPVATPPFYAAFYTTGTLSTCGGVKINKYAQALDYNDEPIPGLYACGAVSANISGGVYLGSGWCLANGMVMGYVAAKHACGLI